MPGIGATACAASHHHWLPPLQDGGLLSSLVLSVSAILLCGLSLIPTHAASLVMGLCLGAIAGPSLALCSIILASLLSFWLSKGLIGDQVTDALRQKPKADLIYQELLKRSGLRTIFLISLVRLSPVMPFAGTNVLMASAKVRTGEFLIGSTLGLAPRVALVALAGAELSSIDWSSSKDYRLIVLGVLSTFLIIFWTNRLIKATLKKELKAS
jgi:uncharacterized membrane protein YdjX (TVP38/TMEM64 family)